MDVREIIVEYNSQYSKKPVVGDVVSTTTSSFDYDGVSHSFEKIDSCVTVKAVKVDEDYSEFEAEKSSTGGCYGYNYYKVIEVL